MFNGLLKLLQNVIQNDCAVTAPGPLPGRVCVMCVLCVRARSWLGGVAGHHGTGGSSTIS